MTSTGEPAGPTLAPARRTLLVETGLVLGVSLGASALWSFLRIVDRLTRAIPLAGQTTTMNSSVTPDRPWLDLAYQLLGITLAVVPAALALHLLATRPGPAIDSDPRGDTPGAGMGFDLGQPGRTLAHGLTLAAVIGLPGLGLYVLAREFGVNTTVAPANLGGAWWALPVLVLAAIQNAILEEVVMVGYLFRRWAQAGWATWSIILVSASIRGSYHLYQGFGGFVGNIAMGAVFGWVYARTRRVMPLVVAHAVLDIVAFVGYALLRGHLSWL